MAVQLAFSHELCTRERLGIRVDDKGVTRLDDGARQMLVATDWKSLDEFRDFLVERIVAKRR